MDPELDSMKKLRMLRSRAPDPDEIDSQVAALAARLTGAAKELRQALADVLDSEIGAEPAAADLDAIIEWVSSAMSDFIELHLDTVGRLFMIVDRIEAHLEADMRAAAMMRAAEG